MYYTTSQVLVKNQMRLVKEMHGEDSMNVMEALAREGYNDKAQLLPLCRAYCLGPTS